MPYKINPFTGNPDFYEASSGGTVTSITAGTGLNGGTITTSGTIDLDITKVPYYSGGPLVSGFTKWNGITWVIDTNSYVNKAGDIMTGYLTLVGDPTSALHAATKQYVDNIAAGINFHAPVVAATTAPLPSVAYSNGAGGVGATLIATAPGALTIDTITFLGGGTERVLIKDQVSGLENGIYVVNIAGDISTPFQLTRATDADNSPTGELAFGDFCFVQQGPTNGNFGYILNTTGTITVGTTALSYVIFNAAQVVTAGTGLTELPTNTLNIDTLKVPYYSGGFVSTGLAKWDGANWVFDNSTYLDTTTAASTYLTQANAASTYYPLTNPAGYITTAALSGYVPYTLATNNVDLGAFQLSTSQLNISTKGTISSSGTNTLLVNNTATDGTTKVQFNGTDILELKGASSVSTITNFRYTNPNNTNQSGPISSMIIDPGTKEWPSATAPNAPGDIQKEIEILSPNYTVTFTGPPNTWDGTPITLYVNPPIITNTPGVGVALGIKGHFIMEGDAIDYPGGTYLDIGSGDGTTIGFTGAKLSFFGNPPIAKPSAVTTVQGLSDALSNLGLISPSTITISGFVPYTGANANVDLGTYSLTTPNLIGGSAVGSSLTYKGTTGNGTSTVSAHNFLVGNNGATTAMQIFNSGQINIGNYASPSAQRILTVGQNTGWVSIGSCLANTTLGAIYLSQVTPDATNHSLTAINNTSTFLNGKTNVQITVNTNVQQLYNSFQSQYTGGNFSGGSGYDIISFKPGIGTNLATSSPIRGFVYEAGSKQFTGSLSTQKEFEIVSPTYSFTIASTITNAFNLYVNENSAGSLATITNNFAAGFSGNIYVSKGILAGSTNTGLAGTGQIYAQSGFFTNANSSLSGIIGYTNSVSIYSKLVSGSVFLGHTASVNVLEINSSGLTISDNYNIILGSSNGTKIGTATTQKIGFFNATPVPQQGAVTTAQGIADALTSLGFLAAGSVVPSGGGGSSWTSVTSVAASATATANVYHLITADSVILTLPNPASSTDRVGVKVTSSATTSIQVKTASVGITIDGTDRSAVGLFLYNQYDAYVFVSDGTNWYIES